MNVRGKVVYVGLSGGVDSAVTAALLKEAGALVTGVFIQGWYPEGMPCTWKEDRQDAMRVAARLHIPFKTLDASHEYKRAVIDYLVKEYKEGRTPNPDIMCNRDVKFGAFYDYAKKQGAAYIATGHYARTKDGRLYRAFSSTKDQSYFLWAVPHDVLSDTLFPLGSLEKSSVRDLAKRFYLPNASKRDSQGICFLGAVSIDDFLRSEIHPKAGKAYDETGMLVGMHDGAVLYTLGERVALREQSGGPWFVIRKNIEENSLTVARSSLKQHLSTTECVLSETLWHEKPVADALYEAQYRYHGPRVRVRVVDEHRIMLIDAPEAVSVGQSLVLYNEDLVMGGGILHEVS